MKRAANRALTSIVLLAVTPASAMAHDGGHTGPADVWHHWAADPLVIAGLVLMALMYTRGIRTLRARAGHGRVVAQWRVASFAAGMAAVAIALLSPLDALADALFSAHMVQHLVLMVIGPALLVMGLPGLVMLWALPSTGRRAVGRWWRRAGIVRSAWHVATLSWVAVLLHAVAVWAWHLPRLYEWAVLSAPVHALEHIAFLTTGMLVWWAALRPRGSARARARSSAQGILVVFATMMQSGALGAVMTFARSPWYPVHGAGPSAWGLMPLEDQQLAGLIMWVVGGLLYTAAAALIFGAWLSLASVSRAAVRVLPALVVVAALSACDARADATMKGRSIVAGGDAARGKRDAIAYGCGSCHTIGGLRGANGMVGPPLTGIARRSIIAGQLANTPDNLIRWLLDPPAVEPGTAMPDLVNDEQTARDLAAYLYTLR